MSQVTDTYDRHKDHICTEQCWDDLASAVKSDIPLLIEVMTNNERQQMERALLEVEGKQ